MPGRGCRKPYLQELIRLVRVAADELIEQPQQLGGPGLRDGLRTQPVQPVDGLLTEAEGVIHVALAGTLRVLTADLGVKAEQEVRRRVENRAMRLTTSADGTVTSRRSLGLMYLRTAGRLMSISSASSCVLTGLPYTLLPFIR